MLERPSSGIYTIVAVFPRTKIPAFLSLLGSKGPQTTLNSNSHGEVNLHDNAVAVEVHGGGLGGLGSGGSGGRHFE